MRPKFSLKRREHKFILLIKDPIFFTLPFELAALLSTVTGLFNLFLFSFFLFSSLSSHNIFAGDFFYFFLIFLFSCFSFFKNLSFFPSISHSLLRIIITTALICTSNSWLLSLSLKGLGDRDGGMR